jgi:hypothetical protein
MMAACMLACHLLLLTRLALVESFGPLPPPPPPPRPCSEGDPYNKMLVFQHSDCGDAGGRNNTLLRVVGDGRDCQCAVAALNRATGMSQNTDGWALSCASGMYASDLGYGPWVGFSGGNCPNLPNGSSVCEPSHHGTIRPSSPGYVWPCQCAAVTDRLTSYIRTHPADRNNSTSPAVAWAGCGGASGPAEFCRGSEDEPPWFLGVQVLGSEGSDVGATVEEVLAVLNHAVNPVPFPTPPPSPPPRPQPRPTPPPPPPAPPPGLWSVGSAGESCDVHCSSMGLECVPPAPDWLPGAPMPPAVWPTYQVGFHQIPAAKTLCLGTMSEFGPPEAPSLGAGSKCFWKPTEDVPSCSAVPASSSRRFCPCVP